MQLISESYPDRSDVGEPRFQRPKIVFGHGCLDTSASVMACDNDILNFQYFNCVLDNRQGIDVWKFDLIGDVSVDKDLPGLKSKNGFGRDSRIRATDKKILGALRIGMANEIGFVFGHFILWPLFVVVDDSLEVVHWLLWCKFK